MEYFGKCTSGSENSNFTKRIPVITNDFLDFVSPYEFFIIMARNLDYIINVSISISTMNRRFTLALRSTYMYMYILLFSLNFCVKFTFLQKLINLKENE